MCVYMSLMSRRQYTLKPAYRDYISNLGMSDESSGSGMPSLVHANSGNNYNPHVTRSTSATPGPPMTSLLVEPGVAGKDDTDRYRRFSRYVQYVQYI